MDRINELQDRLDDLNWKRDMLEVEEEEASYKSDLYDSNEFRERRDALDDRIETTTIMLDYEIVRFADPEEEYQPDRYCNGFYWFSGDDKEEYYNTFCSHCYYKDNGCITNREKEEL